MIVLYIALGIVLAVIILANLEAILALAGGVVLLGIGLVALVGMVYFVAYVSNTPGGIMVPIMMAVIGIPLALYSWWDKRRLERRGVNTPKSFDTLTPRMKQEELESEHKNARL